jgi:hypothetical protein
LVTEIIVAVSVVVEGDIACGLPEADRAASSAAAKTDANDCCLADGKREFEHDDDGDTDDDVAWQFNSPMEFGCWAPSAIVVEAAFEFDAIGTHWLGGKSDAVDGIP